MELQDKEDFAAAQDVYADPELGRVDKDGHLVSLEGENDDDDDNDDAFDGYGAAEDGEADGDEWRARAESGMVDLDMERDAREYRKMMMAQQQNPSSISKDETVTSQVASSASSTRKRDRERSSIVDGSVAQETHSGAQRRVTLDSATAATLHPTSSQDISSLAPEAAVTALPPPALETEIELTDESVRAYILNLGGRVTVAALKEVSLLSRVSTHARSLGASLIISSFSLSLLCC